MTEKSDRVNRGGSWSSGPQYARVANRSSDVPGDRYGDLGIRLVEVTKDYNPHVPRDHRITRGGSWRFQSAAKDRERAYPVSHTSEIRGIRLVEVIDDPESAPAVTPNSLRASRGGGAGGQPWWAQTVNRCLDKVGFKFENLGIRLVEIIDDEPEGST